MALTILLFLAVPALALKSYSYSFIESNVEMGFYLVNDGSQRADQGEALVAALPLNLFRVPEKLFLVVAMLNVLLSMAHLAFISWDWKAGKRVSRSISIPERLNAYDSIDPNTHLPSQRSGLVYHQCYSGPYYSCCHGVVAQSVIEI